MPRKNPPGSVQAPPGALETLTEDEKQLVNRFRDEITLELENYARLARIDDYKKCKPLEWRGFCMHVGKTVFHDRDLLRERVADHGSAQITNNGAYNIPLLNAIYNMYSELCFSVPGLPCRVFDFQAFCNLPNNTITDMPQRVTTLGADFHEKVYKEQENSIAMAGEGGRINVTMALAWNNHFHGWTQAREVIHRDGGQILDGGSWAGRFIGENPKPCSIPEGERKTAPGLQLPEAT